MTERNSTLSTQAQASVIKFRVSFLKWMKLIEVQDFLKNLGIENYSLIPWNGKFTVVVSVPSSEFSKWWGIVRTQPEVDSVWIPREA